jgi:nucleoside-diphosphate-sugar epimerase
VKSALIGYTGFVGGNLLQQKKFDSLYNSKNISDITGNEFDLLICAGAPAEKWKINQNPELDRQNLDILKKALAKTTVKKLVLISTVDVYKNPNGMNEDDEIDTNDLHPYGLHRYELEQFASNNFDATVVRLPGLFGDGIKKNVIFDFLTGNTPFIEKAHSESEYQYYNLDNIWKDIQTALDAGIQLVNFATEPVSTREVARVGFGIDFDNKPESVLPVRYDFRTKYADTYGGTEGYILDADSVLKGIKEFVNRWKQS